ncbi:MAG: hypothetical protein NC483_02440 [Ruminococcus sp.]|nr:hypothetical protein [Ruminococcus sp.]
MDVVDLDEALDFLNNKQLNSKCNNYIFTDLTKMRKKELLDGIKREVPLILNHLSPPEELILPDTIVNIPIDLSSIRVSDILSYALAFIGMTKRLAFTSKFDILKSRGFLREYQKCLSLVFYNGEDISREDRMLLNEIYHFNSCFLTVSDCLEGSNLSTYEISGGRMLDYREDYTRVRIR